MSVCMAKSVTNHIATTRCGLTMPMASDDVTIWHTDTTCPACVAGTVQPDQDAEAFAALRDN